MTPIEKHMTRSDIRSLGFYFFLVSDRNPRNIASSLSCSHRTAIYEQAMKRGLPSSDGSPPVTGGRGTVHTSTTLDPGLRGLLTHRISPNPFIQ